MTRLFNKTRKCLFVFFALLVILPKPAAFAADLNSENLYDPNVVLDVSIEMPADDWKALCEQTRDPGKAFTGEQENPFTWFGGTITINGQKIDSVGVRKKGFLGSLDDKYPSLKIDFSEFKKQHPIEGIDSLTLNNNKQDESLLSQYMAYRLFNEAGIQAPRCNFAKVTVNGEYLGLYSNVESINKSFLKRRFGNDKGNLYEGTVTDFHPKTIDKLEAKTNKKKDDRATIKKLAALLSQDGPVDLAALEQIVDVDNFLRYWALESLIEFWDGYSNNQNNYWVYEDAKTHKLHFIPWGADAAFSTMRMMPMFGPPGPASVYSQGALANKLFRNEAIAARYRETMQQLLRDVWKEDALLAEAKRMRVMLKKDAHARQGQVTPAGKRFDKFIATRREKIEKELGNWPVKIADRPRKPAYTVVVGQASGTFSTPWLKKAVNDVVEQGTMQLHLKLKDKEFAFGRQGAIVYKRPEAGFGFFGGPPGQSKPTAELILSALPQDTDQPIRITLSLEIDKMLKNIGNPIEVSGMYTASAPSMFGFPPRDGKMVRGQLKLIKASDQAGDMVQGEFDLSIVEIHGGFFDQFQQMPGGPPPAGGTNTPGATTPGTPKGPDAGATDTKTDAPREDASKE